MKKFSLLIVLGYFLLPMTSKATDTVPPGSYFELRIYQAATLQQINRLDSFLQQALLPALHKTGIKKIGVFKAQDIDTAAVKKLYVLIPYKSFSEFEAMPAKLQKDKSFEKSGGSYLQAVYNQPVYTRYETVLLRAFEEMPQLAAPAPTNSKKDRVYELRSYESASERLYQNKVQMFNKGGEVTLFNRLGFNAVFYGEVLAGSRMPNLMYMTSFADKASRDEHWKTFGSDPVWKELSARPEYQHNVSKAEIIFLKATDYSDL